MTEYTGIMVDVRLDEKQYTWKAAPLLYRYANASGASDVLGCSGNRISVWLRSTHQHFARGGQGVCGHPFQSYATVA